MRTVVILHWVGIYDIFVSGYVNGVNSSNRMNIFSKRMKRHRNCLNMVLNAPVTKSEKGLTQTILDDLIDANVRTAAKRPIVLQFSLKSSWLWKQWKGTVFSKSWPICVRNMLFATLVTVFLNKRFPTLTEQQQQQHLLVGFDTLWIQLLSVTTFTLTFFLDGSYKVWRNCMELSRRLQGRLSDINMSLAAHAARSPSEDDGYTPAASSLLQIMGRYTRLFNLLVYASLTRSHRPILTPSGLRRAVERGLLTPGERECLVGADMPATQRHTCVMMWMLRLFVDGRKHGHFGGGNGFESEFLDKVYVIRAQVDAISGVLQGRMPLAYAHIVQVLVDTVLWMYPVVAYICFGFRAWLVVVGTGLLSLFYQGLLELAKQFLDPYDNENYGKAGAVGDPLRVETLIAESNAASVRWMEGGRRISIPGEKMREGELNEYVLPLRGFSVEEVQARKDEKKKKEFEKERRVTDKDITRERIKEKENDYLENERNWNQKSNGLEQQHVYKNKQFDSDPENMNVLEQFRLSPERDETQTKITLNTQKVEYQVKQPTNSSLSTGANYNETSITVKEQQEQQPYKIQWSPQEKMHLSEILTDKIWDNDEKEQQIQLPLILRRQQLKHQSNITTLLNEFVQDKISKIVQLSEEDQQHGETIDAYSNAVDSLSGINPYTKRMEGAIIDKEVRSKIDEINGERKQYRHDETKEINGISQLHQSSKPKEGDDQFWSSIGNTVIDEKTAANITRSLHTSDNGNNISQITNGVVSPDPWRDGDGTLDVLSDDNDTSHHLEQHYRKGPSEPTKQHIVENEYNMLMFADTDSTDWFDEMGPDGKEIRLSQMLADEIWEDEEEDDAEEEKEEESFYGRYIRQEVNDIIEKVEMERERLEEKAIIDAPPGANVVEMIIADEDVGKNFDKDGKGDSIDYFGY